MNFFKKLGHNLSTALIILVIALIGFASSAFLISTDLRHIPFGFLLSGGILAVIHVLSHLLVKLDERRGSSIFTIISMILRLVIILTSLLLICFMYYRWDIKLFNVFVFVGMYTLGIVVLCLSFVFIKDGKE